MQCSLLQLFSYLPVILLSQVDLAEDSLAFYDTVEDVSLLTNLLDDNTPATEFADDPQVLRLLSELSVLRQKRARFRTSMVGAGRLIIDRYFCLTVCLWFASVFSFCVYVVLMNAYYNVLSFCLFRPAILKH